MHSSALLTRLTLAFSALFDARLTHGSTRRSEIRSRFECSKAIADNTRGGQPDKARCGVQWPSRQDPSLPLCSRVTHLPSLPKNRCEMFVKPRMCIREATVEYSTTRVESFSQRA
ncbi:hypothetical protein EDB83DRAFT_1327823 [Lactarius deliciosus]|nr:hypothetical protein EDB83DRAFT_1327823 [Lactarius deliciosus]